MTWCVRQESRPPRVYWPVLIAKGERRPAVQVRIFLDSERTLVVQSVNNGPTNVYVERISWNDVDLTEPYLTHAELAVGGSLTFYMTDIPTSTFNTNNDIVRTWAAKKLEAKKLQT